jgi:hypothetical protein
MLVGELKLHSTPFQIREFSVETLEIFGSTGNTAILEESLIPLGSSTVDINDDLIRNDDIYI